ncbi:unnamed protein product [Ixodes pacificus]
MNLQAFSKWLSRSSSGLSSTCRKSNCKLLLLPSSSSGKMSAVRMCVMPRALTVGSSSAASRPPRKSRSSIMLHRGMELGSSLSPQMSIFFRAPLSPHCIAGLAERMKHPRKIRGSLVNRHFTVRLDHTQGTPEKR